MNEVYYPRLGQFFELTLDGNYHLNTPMGMVKDFGGYPSTDWEHAGTALTGKETRLFMLVPLNHSPRFDDIKETLELNHGETPAGQWIIAFNARFPGTSRSMNVGIADSSWIDHNGCPRFPVKRTANNRPHFKPIYDGISGQWLWLVYAPEELSLVKTKNPDDEIDAVIASHKAKQGPPRINTVPNQNGVLDHYSDSDGLATGMRFRHHGAV